MRNPKINSRRPWQPWQFLALLFFAPAAGAHQAPIATADFADNYGSPLVYNVLANDRELEGEALTITSTSTAGCNSNITVAIDGPRLLVTTADFVPRNCTIGYTIEDERGSNVSSSLTLTAVQLLIFSDGFETGNTSRWSSVEP